MAGFTGKYCIINLTNGETRVVKPGEAFYKKYLSGYGLGAAVISELQKPGIDPLSAESYLGFCSGLLTGSGAAFSGRFMVVGKSPLTGGWGDANAGGHFSLALKRAGYDAIFFTGASKKPVWVFITDERIEIKEASKLWGKDIVETEALIREELKNEKDMKVQIASVGVSGEKLSLISGIATDKSRIAARSGLGAVMGSKHLKAVVLSGKNRVQIAEPDTLRAINRKFLKEFKKSGLIDRITLKLMKIIGLFSAYTGILFPARPSLLREILKKYGTSGLTTYSAMIGDMPIKNWDGVGHLDYSADSAAKTSDESVLKHQKRRYACHSCPLGCGGILNIQKGRYKGQQGYKPEYETLGSFGGLLLLDDLDAIIELNEMCNRAGIDTISTGGVIAFAIECFENGIIDEQITGGLKLGWGKSEEIVRLAEMIIRREGFGDMLADGVKKAAERIGKGSEKFAMHAGGQELPMHDSRLDPGYAIAYQCEPTPGRHTISSYLYAGLFGVKKKFPEARRMIRSARGKLEKDVRQYTAGTFYMQLINCSGMCLFGAMTSALPLVEYLNAVTGWDLSADEYFRTGERILNLRKAFNMREGITPGDHRIHNRAIGKQPLPKGPLKGVVIDMEALEETFFETVGWDSHKGGPTPEKMKALEIDSLFPEL
ncbi:aldehyde ferredoxin oxidoreductase family protein [Desulfobacterales bacterium HSG2]|nr:aldehyde ferredoxin oxidoreductase family protein [Desulfobacterales bacterium HSG2]